MRFQGKHRFFKRVLCEAQNFKNVPLTLADRHQKMMAYHLDSSSFFKPALALGKVKSVMISSFPVSEQQQLMESNANTTVLSATSVNIDGVRYAADMVVSTGSCAGLPEFR